MKQQARLVYLSQVSGLNINRVRERSKYFLMYLINYSLSIGSLSSFMMTLLCPIATYFLFVFFLPFIKAYFIYLTLYHLFCSILLITRYFVLHFFFWPLLHFILNHTCQTFNQKQISITLLLSRVKYSSQCNVISAILHTTQYSVSKNWCMWHKYFRFKGWKQKWPKYKRKNKVECNIGNELTNC